MLANDKLVLIYGILFHLKTSMEGASKKPSGIHFEIKETPYDLAICVALALILVALVIFAPDNAARKVIGLIFILFLPGYAATSALFPENHQIDTIERVALSFGLSIAIVPLIGLALNYTPWGIKLEPILASVSAFIIGASAIAWYRRNSLPLDERFTIVVDLRMDFGGMPMIDKLLTIGIVVMLAASVVVIAYAIATPRTGERFTQLAILGPGGMAADYPRNLTVGQSGTVILTIESFEHQSTDYSIVITLTNSTDTNFTVVENTIDWNQSHLLAPYEAISQNFSLEHRESYNHTFTFSVSSPGTWKLQFLLFKEGQPISQDSYLEVHLWLNVT